MESRGKIREEGVSMDLYIEMRVYKEWERGERKKRILRKE